MKETSSPAERGSKSRLVAGILVVFAAGLMLSACNTTRGAGEDISNAGTGVSRAATDVQKKL